MSENSDQSDSGGGLSDLLPLDELKSTAGDYAKALGNSAMEKAGDTVSNLTDRLTDYANGGAAGEAAAEGAEALAEGESPAKAGLSALTTGAKEKVKETFGGGGGGGDGQKFINIVESIEVGVPLRVAYNQWTEFEQWSDFMKKVENAEHEEEDGKVNFKGQVFWSHRSWESTIVDQMPDQHIVWESTGEKGHLDGAVTFHSLGDRLTRILVVVEYHPQGFMERTANIWRAVGRRVRLELKFFVHHVMTTTLLDPDSVEGWRGEIRDKEVVLSHEEGLQEDQAEEESQSEEPAEEDSESEEPAEEESAEAEDQSADEETDEAESDETEDEPADQEAEEADEAEEEKPRANRRKR